MADIGPCRLHYYGTRGVYATDCQVIERDFHKRLIFVVVALKNVGKQAVEFDVEHFLFVDRQGRSFDPVRCTV